MAWRDRLFDHAMPPTRAVKPLDTVVSDSHDVLETGLGDVEPPSSATPPVAPWPPEA
jgi:hypothetical protein